MNWMHAERGQLLLLLSRLNIRCPLEFGDAFYHKKSGYVYVWYGEAFCQAMKATEVDAT